MVCACVCVCVWVPMCVWGETPPVNFNNSNQFLSCDLYECKWNFRNMYLSLCHHFELPRKEPKPIFGSVIGWYLKKKKKFFFQLSFRHMYLFSSVRSQLPKIPNLKCFKAGLLLSFLGVILDFSFQKISSW